MSKDLNFPFEQVELGKQELELAEKKLEIEKMSFRQRGRLFDIEVSNKLLKQISDYKLYINLAVLAGWVSVVAGKGPILSILIPIFSVVAILLSMIGLHAGFNFVSKGGNIKDGPGYVNKYIEVNSNLLSNIVTVLVLIGFLVNVYFLSINVN
ncbi:TPA: hypothetical protein DCR79_01740 [Patescibacteria group bacterium]|nr:hypothetical protein [Patescibacteria group bacterium]